LEFGIWSLELGIFVCLIRESPKTGDSFDNRGLARRRGIRQGEGVTKQGDSVFVKRAKSLRERPFIVQCSDFRCMAYRDSSGKWLDYFNGDELKGEVKVVSEA